MTHPAAELLRAIADGKQMEEVNAAGAWHKCYDLRALDLISQNRASELRIACPMVTRQVSYPEPLRVKPQIGEKYWTVTSAYDEIQCCTWSDHPVDHRIFAAGMAFATEADAAEAHRALYGAQV